MMNPDLNLQPLDSGTLKRLHLVREILDDMSDYDKNSGAAVYSDPQIVALAMIGASIEELTLVLSRIADQKLKDAWA